jgi:hypothetical protein
MLNLFSSHLELLIADLGNALLELLQAHHFDVGGVNESLKLGWLNITGISNKVGKSLQLMRYEVSLRDALEFAKKGSVPEEPDILRVKIILE